MAVVIAVIQQKGGVGKSTITANVAAELLHSRREVLLLDLDPQQSLSQWARMGEGGVLRDRVRAIDMEELSTADFKASVEAAKKDADVVLLDSPPGFPEAGMLAALAADLALLPVTPSPLDIHAASQALELIREARSHRGGKRPLIGLIPSKVLHSTILGRDLPVSLKDFGEPVLPGVSQRIAIAEAVINGLTLREYDERSAGVEEFRNLTRSILKMVMP